MTCVRNSEMFTLFDQTNPFPIYTMGINKIQMKLYTDTLQHYLIFWKIRNTTKPLSGEGLNSGTLVIIEYNHYKILYSHYT